MSLQAPAPSDISTKDSRVLIEYWACTSPWAYAPLQRSSPRHGSRVTLSEERPAPREEGSRRGGLPGSPECWPSFTTRRGHRPGNHHGPGLTETKSRVSRAVLALEPSDILTLRRAASLEPTKGSAAVGGGLVLSIRLEPSCEPLSIAGCMADANVWGGGVRVTDVGRAVLKALELWR